MQIGMIPRHTRICGKSQGFMGLPLRDETLRFEDGGTVNEMTSAWLPTPKELEALNAGAAVHVKIWGEVPSPMLVEVGELPE